MTAPKEKAKELVDKMRDEIPCHCDDWEQAKQCALIAVDEMLSNDGWSSSRNEWDRFKKYCEEVKQEIEKI